jgi:hypothetical protein
MCRFAFKHLHKVSLSQCLVAAACPSFFSDGSDVGAEYGPDTNQ